MPGKDLDWLGDMRWQGYPRLEAVRNLGPDAGEGPPSAPPPKSAATDPRVLELSRENEALRSRLEELSRLSAEFDRRLGEAGAAYEGAMLETESRLRDAVLEREHMSGALQAAKAEASLLTARDAARESDLRLERERRGDAEKALAEARRRLETLVAETEHLRSSSAEQAGALAELRRQASSQNERLFQAKVLTDQDVALLRQEMRDFLARLHRIQESLGENK